MDERTVSMCRVPKQPILQETGNAQGDRRVQCFTSEIGTDTDDRVASAQARPRNRGK